MILHTGKRTDILAFWEMISPLTTPVLIFTDNRHEDFVITDKASGGFYGCRGMTVDMNTNMGELDIGGVEPRYCN